MNLVEDAEKVRGKAFVFTSDSGILDGEGVHGLFAADVRLLRRIELFGAHREAAYVPQVAVGYDGAALRFNVSQCPGGEGLLLVAEIDGYDVVSLHKMNYTNSPYTALEPDQPITRTELGSSRALPHVRISAECSGAILEHQDGIALAREASYADGTPRTAAWRWRVPEGEPQDVTIDLRIAWSHESGTLPPTPRTFDQLHLEQQTEREAWLNQRPTLVSNDPTLDAVYQNALNDLAALRMDAEAGVVVAASVPWQATLMGRQALLAAMMLLPVDPKIAQTLLRELALSQATTYDRSVDAEPGKIIQEERKSLAGERWHSRYYGSADSTPLFLMLAEEYSRWTADDRIIRELEPNLRAAADWIWARLEDDEHSLLASVRYAERGSDSHYWKSNLSAYRDRSGRVAQGRLRSVESQGYAVGALFSAAAMARRVWNDEAIADHYESTAVRLVRAIRDRFNTMIPTSALEGDDPRAPGIMALGIDDADLPLDSFTSNQGHLLWAHPRVIPEAAIATRIVDQLKHPAMNSGYGVRTMSTLDIAYEPKNLYCGAVWAFDTALCVAGIASRDPETGIDMAGNLLEAAIDNDCRMPSVISGNSREKHPHVELLREHFELDSLAASAPILLLHTMLGLQIGQAGNLESAYDTAPKMLHGLVWEGVYAHGARWVVKVDQRGAISVAKQRD